MRARALVWSALIETGLIAVVRADEVAVAQSRIATLDRTIMVRAAASGSWPAAPTHDGGPDIFLPPDLALLRDGWVSVAREDGREPTAKNHAGAFGGRSMFLLRVKLPAGAVSPEVFFKAVADV